MSNPDARQEHGQTSDPNNTSASPIPRQISILVVLTLTALAARFWWVAPFFASYDGPLHLLRVYALDLALRQGMLYPRWLPDLGYGLGYPLFNFYPPLSAYLAETSAVLGLGFIDALRVTFTLIIAVAALGAYFLGRDLLARCRKAELAGVLTAAAYIFFPYFMVGLYTRAALAECLAQAILPWLFWSVRRILRASTTSPVLLTALLLAMLILAHSMTAVLAAPVLVAYVLFELWRLAPEQRGGGFIRAAVGAVLGTALAAFYWLPFVTELSLVRMGRGMDIIAGIFESNFQAVGSLVQSSWLYQYGGPPVPLGLAAVMLAVLTFAGVLLVGRSLVGRGPVLFFGAVAFVAALAMTLPARDLWLTLSLANLLQSVWRVSVLVNLGCAIVIGALPLVLAALVERTKQKPVPRTLMQVLEVVACGLAVVVLAWTALANLQPRELVLTDDEFTPARLARFEGSGGNPGTTTFGEYMPATATAPDLVNYRTKSRDTSGAAPELALVAQDGTRWTFNVSSASPFAMSLREFYFPNWVVTIDGRAGHTYSTTPMGLLTFNIPAGQHRVQVWLQDSAVEQVGNWLTVAAVLLLAGLELVALWRHEAGAWMPLFAGGLLLGAFLVPSARALAAPPQSLQSMRASLSQDADLIGLRVQDTRFESDTWQVSGQKDRLELDVFWQVKGSALNDAPVTWRLVDASGRVWAERAQLPRFGSALQRTWIPNEVVQDAYTLPLPGSIPSGRYALQVAFAKGEAVTVGAVQLLAGSAPTAPAPQIAHSLDARLGDQIRLLGYDSSPQAQPGQRYPVTLWWEAEGDVFEDYTASVQLLAPDGKLVTQHDSLTGEGLSPSSTWIPGRPVVERRDLELPTNLPPGTYTLVALLYRLSDLKRLPVTTSDGPARDDAVVLTKINIIGRGNRLLASSLSATETRFLASRLASGAGLAETWFLRRAAREHTP